METDPLVIRRHAQRQLRVDKQLQLVAAARADVELRRRRFELHRRVLEASLSAVEREAEYWQRQEELSKLVGCHAHCPRPEQDEARSRDQADALPEVQEGAEDAEAAGWDQPHWDPLALADSERRLAALLLRESLHVKAIADLGQQLAILQDPIARLSWRDRVQTKEREMGALTKLHENCPSRISASVLPDDTLLEVFKKLNAKSLRESVRPVCSQWRRVAGHRFFWNEACFRVWHPVKLPIMHMRAATYVKDLSISLNKNTSDAVRRNLLEYQWEGRVEALTINLSSFTSNSPCDYSLAVKLYRKFMKDLTSFQLLTDPERSHRFQKDDARALLHHLRTSSRLKKLTLHSREVLSLDEPVRFPLLALEELDVGLFENSSVILSNLVAASRQSLKTFDSFCASDLTSFACLMAELARCPNLTRVSLPLCQDFTAVSASPSLGSVHLKCQRRHALEYAPISLCIQSLAYSRLTSLRVDARWSEEDCVLLTAIQYLTQLTSLTMRFERCLVLVMDLITPVLLGLQQLEELDMGRVFPQGPDEVYYLYSNPDMVPRLERLSVARYYFNGDTCVYLDHLLKLRPSLCIVGPKHYEAKWKPGVLCDCTVCLSRIVSQDNSH